jgi:glutamine synthetase
MNLIVAESLSDLVDELEAALGDAKGTRRAAEIVPPVLAQIVETHRRVVFSGDNYSLEWHGEAATRGLPNLPSSEEAFEVYRRPEVKALFERFGVLNARELDSRYQILVEKYRTEVLIEARTMIALAEESIIPAVCDSANRLSMANEGAGRLNGAKSALTKRLALHLETLEEFGAAIDRLREEVDRAEADETVLMKDSVRPAMAVARSLGDRLEALCADQDWQLPRYREMLPVR